MHPAQVLACLLACTPQAICQAVGMRQCALLSRLAALQELLVGQKSPADSKRLHVMSSGLKAGATWSRVEILQVCLRGATFNAATALSRLWPESQQGTLSCLH